jgi:flagellar biosynthesis/type III secretory pathway M-ring protein FliF/YscJ
MTLQIDGVDVMNAIEIAAWVGSIVAMLVIGLIIWLMVRPPRREEMLRLLDRMEQRLEVLERAVAVEAREEDRLLEAGDDSPETRRTK